MSERDVHDRDADALFGEVHSFQHWFDSVEGYLHETRYGRDPALGEPPPPKDKEALISALCNYCVGETAALEASSGLIAIAPNRACKIFLATQVVDEARHVEVFYRRLQELGVADPEAEIGKRAASSLVAFKDSLLDLVHAKDWDAAIFAQNVILEAMEFAVFESHSRSADPVTADMLQRVLKDERRHMGFGENELGRRIKLDEALRQRLSDVKQRLDRLVLRSFEENLDMTGLPAERRPDLARHYLGAVGRLGVAP